MENNKNLWIVLTIAAVLCLLFIEKFTAGSHIYGQLIHHREDGLGAFLYQHGKAISRIGTLTVVIFAIFLVPRLRHYSQLYLEHFSTRQWVFIPIQLLLFLGFYYLTPIALPANSESSLALQLPWLFIGLASGFVALQALAAPRFWAELLGREKWFLVVAIALSSAVWVFGLYTQYLWESMSEVTFDLVAATLTGVGFEVYSEPAAKIIGIDDFLVSIAAACSGYEGIGLITAFTCVYLYVFKTEFKFPRAFLLLPLGATIIWCFNILRIDLLILIGAYWSPDIAVQGFHTQAGWITFIVTSVLLMMLAHKIPWFTHRATQTLAVDEVNSSAASQVAHTSGSSSRESVPLNLATATLLPLIVLLAMTFVTQALSGGFDWLYPLRVIATLICLAYCWRALDLRPLHLSYKGGLAVGAGLFVAALWYLMVAPSEEVNNQYQTAISETSPLLMALWLAFRFVGSAVTVPIAEELGFRAYLLCRAAKQEVVSRGEIPFNWVSFAINGVAFGALHGDWIAGVAAGLIYALVRYRSRHVADAIVAHSVTNFSLCVVAALTGNWYLL